jgi:aminopeptidase N
MCSFRGTVLSILFLLATAGCTSVSDPQSPSPVPMEILIAPGVSEALAHERARRISDLRYELRFHIPEEPAAPVTGRVAISLTLTDADTPLIIDFAAPEEHLRSLQSGGRPISAILTNGHIIIPPSALTAGRNRLEIDFVAGDGPLNRSSDFLYTLLVPARAAEVFPSFDQPDLKARYSLQLDIPAAWEALANGAEVARRPVEDRLLLGFAETEPLSTYLFAFTAGSFSVVDAERNGRRFRMLHRESDPEKLSRNADVIFDLHASSLEWLERYTGIPYPWGDFSFVLFPAFQFGGMEHPGAIFYNASRLMLDQTATQEQQLGRASLIAHETAHMWFGNLVTMRWFNDVWMKEVFANFMAAKIVNPEFPEIDHELRYLFAHYPAAYEIDRSAGANAIRQQLANLNDAGSLYGAIIYQKAPIVMRQLEMLLGEESLREGLQEYLTRYSFGNASWPELIAILDARTTIDLASWSHVWVEEPGRPVIETRLAIEEDRIDSLRITQQDPRGRNLHWTQQLAVVVALDSDAVGRDEPRQLSFPVRLSGDSIEIAEARGLPAPLFVLPAGEGLGYGRFVLDPASRRYLLENLPAVDDPLTRGSAWLVLWDAMLEGEITPSELIDLTLRALPVEDDELITQRVLNYLQRGWWKFLTGEQRARLAPRLEGTLHEGLARATTSSRKAAWFATLRNTAISSESVAWLERLWSGEETVEGLTFSESDRIDLALELAVRGVARSDELLARQLERTENRDRQERLAFVAPALSADPIVRAAFFESLRDVRNRRREPWVLEALSYLHHPLRSPEAERFILPSLQLLAEIRETGDIFFPKRWLDATLGGHQSAAAAATVRGFLETLPADYPPRLRLNILSSADELFRATRLLSPEAASTTAPRATVSSHANRTDRRR